jgi:hypothetical protein
VSRSDGGSPRRRPESSSADFTQRFEIGGLLDRGELAGENPNRCYQGDHAELELRLAELEARVEDDKRLGALDDKGRRWPWKELSESVKFNLIRGEIDNLHLGTELRPYAIIDRDVDIRGVSGERRREFKANRFDSVAANLRQQWYDDGLGAGGDRWEDQSTRYKVSYLAEFAGANTAPFKRFAEAARPLLGMAPGEEFTADQEWVTHEFHASREKYESRRVEPGRLGGKTAERQLWPSELAKANRHKQPGQEQGRNNEKVNGKDTGHSI